jgi:hypothetical protein
LLYLIGCAAASATGIGRHQARHTLERTPNRHTDCIFHLLLRRLATSFVLALEMSSSLEREILDTIKISVVVVVFRILQNNVEMAKGSPRGEPLSHYIRSLWIQNIHCIALNPPTT